MQHARGVAATLKFALRLVLLQARGPVFWGDEADNGCGLSQRMAPVDGDHHRQGYIVCHNSM